MGRIKKARGIKAASRIGREKLLENAEILAEHPEKILPVCNNRCTFCIFANLKEQLKSVSAVSESKSKLKWKILFGNKIIKAYAGFLTVRFSDTLAVLATVKLPFGTYSFAMRGNSPREIQLAIQHFDEPMCKALAFLNYAKKGYFFFVADDVYCSGRDLKMPEIFKKHLLKELPYKLLEREGILTCGHSHSALIIRMKGNKLAIKICSKCARTDVNLLSRISAKILGRNIESTFTVSYLPSFNCAGTCDKCIFEEFHDDAIEKNYKVGHLNDMATLLQYMNSYRETLRKRKTKIYIGGNTCFGNNIEKFVETFASNEDEKKIAMICVKNTTHPIVLKENTFAKFLEEIWEERGRDALIAVSSEEIAEKFYSPDTKEPFESLRKAKREFELKKLENSLPKFKKLSPRAKFIHEIAMEYMLAGRPAAITYISAKNLEDTKMRTIAYAFLNYFGVADAHAWQFTKEEKELGMSLSKFVEELLNARGEKYREALNNILRYSGTGEEAK